MKIIAETCADAHEVAFDVIMNSHSELDIQTHVDKKEFTLEFLSEEDGDDFLHIKILHPEQEPQISGGAMFKEGFAEAYRKQFLTISPHRDDGNHATYTYWNRMKDFPFPACTMGKPILLGWYGDGRGNGFDQITPLIQKLAGDFNNRRGVIVTWNPLLDANSREPPCMDFIQFVTRNGKLHMRVVFRSQDMLSALGENLVGCTAFFRYVLEGIWRYMPSMRDVDYPSMGTLTILSLIPHIYKKRDGKEFDVMRAHIYAKKMNKTWNPKIVG